MVKKTVILDFISKIIISILVSILFFLIYRAYLPWTSVSNYLFYVFITLIFILAFILSLYLNQVHKIVFYILFSIFIISIYSIEYKFLHHDWRIVKSSIENPDTRSKYKVYKDLKNNNEGVVVEVLPVYNILRSSKLHPNLFTLSGVSNSLTIGCNERGFYRTYRSDKFGFNNPNYVWQKKNIDYLFIGDSMVHGACENRPDDIASVIRNSYNLNALNLGYGGNGPLIELATLREYYKKNTKNIAWFFFEGNDFANLEVELSNRILSKYLYDDTFTQNLKNNQNIVNDIAREVINFEFKNQFFKFLKLYNVRLSLLNYRTLFKSHKVYTVEIVDEIVISEFKKIILKAKNFANENNSNFYFFIIPDIERYNFNQNNLDILKTNKTKLINFLEKNEIVYFDLYDDLFINYKKEEIFNKIPHHHLNKKGYNLLGNYIYKKTYN